jgi:hypothetical protein
MPSEVLRHSARSLPPTLLSPSAVPCCPVPLALSCTHHSHYAPSACLLPSAVHRLHSSCRSTLHRQLSIFAMSFLASVVYQPYLTQQRSAYLQEPAYTSGYEKCEHTISPALPSLKPILQMDSAPAQYNCLASPQRYASLSHHPRSHSDHSMLSPGRRRTSSSRPIPSVVLPATLNLLSFMASLVLRRHQEPTRGVGRRRTHAIIVGNQANQAAIL